MLDKLIQKDQEFFLFLNGLGNETWDAFWLFMTDKWSSVPLYIFLLIWCFWKLKWKPTVLILVLVAVMIAATDQLANAFKYGFERLRPCHDEAILYKMRLVKAYCGGKFGYFSAHASNSFAVATFFSLLFRRYVKYLPFLLLLWALVVSYSRIYIGVHYPLDVITGITFGMLIGWVFFGLYSYGSNRFNFLS